MVGAVAETAGTETGWLAITSVRSPTGGGSGWMV
jgi:hypothetical protein